MKWTLLLPFQVEINWQTNAILFDRLLERNLNIQCALKTFIFPKHGKIGHQSADSSKNGRTHRLDPQILSLNWRRPWIYFTWNSMIIINGKEPQVILNFKKGPYIFSLESRTSYSVLNIIYQTINLPDSWWIIGINELLQPNILFYLCVFDGIIYSLLISFQWNLKVCSLCLALIYWQKLGLTLFSVLRKPHNNRHDSISWRDK